MTNVTLPPLPYVIGTLTVQCMVPTTGRYLATCKCGGAVSLSRREVILGSITKCPGCAHPRAKAALQHLPFAPGRGGSGEVLPPNELVGERFGAVVIKKVFDVGSTPGQTEIQIRCDRCYAEAQTTLQTLRRRYGRMLGETDCGCSAKERRDAEVEELQRKRNHRNMTRDIKERAKGAEREAKNLAG